MPASFSTSSQPKTMIWGALSAVRLPGADGDAIKLLVKSSGSAGASTASPAQVGGGAPPPPPPPPPPPMPPIPPPPSPPLPALDESHAESETAATPTNTRALIIRHLADWRTLVNLIYECKV